MKLFGILLIVVAGIGTGTVLARRLYQRADWLRAVVCFLTTLEDKLTYTAAPLADLWQMLVAGESTATYPLVKKTAAGLKQGLAFETAFAAALEEAMCAGLLLPPEREWLDALGVSLGRSNLTQQAAHIRHCREGLLRALEAAQQCAQARGSIYRMMGLAGGACVAMLLL